MQNIKPQLHQLCVSLVEKRISNCLTAINNAQNSANNETKSSAGDKHETGRAMAQLETENNATQLAQANKLKRALSQINPQQKLSQVKLGALVETDRGNFYISVGLGKITLNSQTYYAISAISPLGQAMINKQEGESFSFNNNSFTIFSIL